MIKSCKKPPVYFPTVTGDICSFNSQYAGLPLKSCTSLISGYQEGSGTPSPSNVRPLHAWSGANLTACGVNLWDEEWEVGAYNSSGQKTSDDTRIRSKNFIPVKSGEFYYVLFPNNSTGRIFFYDKNYNFLRRTTDAGSRVIEINVEVTCYITFYCLGTTYNNDISINSPSADTSYHAYIGNTHLFTFGQSIYQGYIDWKRGVVVGLWSGKVDMGLLNWGYNSNFQVFYISLPNMYIPTTGQERMQGIANEVYPISTVDAISSMDDKSCLRYNGYLWTKDSDYTDRDNFKNSLIGKYVAYELATPIEIPLGGINLLTQQGVNNIFADCGDTTLEYLKAGR